MSIFLIYILFWTCYIIFSMISIFLNLLTLNRRISILIFLKWTIILLIFLGKMIIILLDLTRSTIFLQILLFPNLSLILLCSLLLKRNRLHLQPILFIQRHLNRSQFLPKQPITKISQHQLHQ